ncbi:hypothetical protein MLD38_038369 [Melastoma candidum]|uniref:Uncharacterized protein n=1 Tax=Melastoma candidum TaxID=119954 RepID=A0ACB9KZE7_9MYRT|nr:hypothetical protein MLD38_038369 [Melastoma candidum]
MVMYRKICKGEFQCPNWMPPDMKQLIMRLLDSNPETRITVDEIINNQWFRNGYRAAKPHFYMEEFNRKEEEGSWDRLDGAEEQQGKCMNAFDIISLSLGIDLMSNDLDSGGGVSLTAERYVSAEPAEAILETVTRAGEEEDGVEVIRWRKGWGLRLEGRDGEFVVSVTVHRLTDELIVVEAWIEEVTDIVGHTGNCPDSGGGGSNRGGCTWKDKLKDMIGALAYRPEETATGE